MKRRFISILMALVMALSCAMAATAEEAKTSIAVCLASEPDTLDPALNSSVDGATLTSHLFSGLATWAQDAEGRLLELVQADAMRDMIAGSIRSSSVRTEQSGGCIRLYASLRCEEMIARMRPASLKAAIE